MPRTITISKQIAAPPQCLRSEKAITTARLFGLTKSRLAARTVSYNAHLEIRQGDVIFITGASGAGKSILLGEIERFLPAGQSVNLNSITLPDSPTVIDGLFLPVFASMKLLSCSGLAETFCILNSPANLSVGEKFRYILALALKQNKRYVIVDEFCSNLDRITASVISWRIRNFARKNRTVFILASAHEDIIPDLQPDCIVSIDLTGKIDVTYRELSRR